MASIELTEQTFNDTIADNNIVFVDFWAEWCGPCRMFAPVYETVAQKNPDIVFGKVDTEAETSLAAAFQISSIPTLVVIRENIILYAEPGALRQENLEELVQAVRDADMDKIRREVSASMGKES